MKITQEEADRLLIILLDSCKTQINTYCDNNDLKLNQNAFDALTDLFYNRNSNSMTQEVLQAMAQRDDQKVLALLLKFDYDYARDNLPYEPQAYVDRNPGLAKRRKEEYKIYKDGFADV